MVGGYFSSPMLFCLWLLFSPQTEVENFDSIFNLDKNGKNQVELRNFYPPKFVSESLEKSHLELDEIFGSVSYWPLNSYLEVFFRLRKFFPRNLLRMEGWRNFFFFCAWAYNLLIMQFWIISVCYSVERKVGKSLDNIKQKDS